MRMKKNELKTLEIKELKNVSGGVALGPNGESCTEHWLPDFLKNKTPLDILKLR
jgi:bacteriocin-like protein